jgi:N-acetyl-anhydromuramyl-L-alanine amidase AmpD
MKQPDWHTELTARYLSDRAHPIQGIVLHDTAGSGTHNDTLYLAHPGDGREVSVDFTVERDGSVWKLNPQLALYHTNHAGRATSWREHTNAAVNHCTVGIEIVASAARPIYPPVQVRAVAVLCAWLVSYFGLRQADITSHRAIITDRSRSDPRAFPWDAFWREYAEAAG